MMKVKQGLGLNTVEHGGGVAVMWAQTQVGRQESRARSLPDRDLIAPTCVSLRGQKQRARISLSCDDER